MFRPDPKKRETRMSCAAIEACKAKKLYGALRALWRSASCKGADDRITHLKSLVAPSPTRPLRPTDVVNEQSEMVPADDNDDENEMGDHSSSDEGDEVPVPPLPAPPVLGDIDSDSDHLNSPTLELGTPSPEGVDGEGVDGASSPEGVDELGLEECEVEGSQKLDDPLPVHSSPSPPPSPASSELRDSQVPGAGWMGRAMIAARSLEREEKEKAKMEEEVKRYLDCIWEALNLPSYSRHEDDDVEGCWEGYKAYCKMALKTYGHSVLEKLCNIDFFAKWLDNFTGLDKDKDPCMANTMYLDVLKLLGVHQSFSNFSSGPAGVKEGTTHSDTDVDV